MLMLRAILRIPFLLLKNVSTIYAIFINVVDNINNFVTLMFRNILLINIAS